MHAESFGMIADGPDEIRKAVRLCCLVVVFYV